MAHLLAAGGLLAGFLAANTPYAMKSEAQAPRLPVAGGAGVQTADLLGRCGRGDAEAFRSLYQAQSSRLYGTAMRITRNQALASDAVHDAMLQVWRNAARYDPERGNADGWLLSLVRYRALDIARRQGRETTGMELPDQADESPDVLSRLMSDQDGIALRRCLEQVPPARRRLVELAFIQGMSQSEIAVHVAQPLGTVKSSIRRVLLALRACLQAGEGTPS